MEFKTEDNEKKIDRYIYSAFKAHARAIEEIKAGCSEAEKYKVKIDNKLWMLKIVKGTSLREMWYRELAKYRGENLIPPKYFHHFNDDVLCLFTPWKEGVILEEYLKSASHSEIENLGKQAANMLLKLHRPKYFFPRYKEHIEQRVEKICDDIKKYSLEFPGNLLCCNFMLDYLKNYSVDSVRLVHRDIRPENFIVSNGNLMLIDFENGGIGEYVEDFSYLTTIIPPEHYNFSEIVLKNYLENINQEEFWNKNMFFSTLKVAEYAVWKFKRSGRQMKYQAENLMKQYNCFSSVYPEWLVN